MPWHAIGVALFGLIVAWSGSARAFVGFYVVRGEAAPDYRATTVVLLRRARLDADGAPHARPTRDAACGGKVAARPR